MRIKITKIHFIIGLASMGLLLSMGLAARSHKNYPVQPLAKAAPKIPFQSYIAAEGVIEPASSTINISPSNYGCLVEEVYVMPQEMVECDQALFKLDTSNLILQLSSAEQELKLAQIELEKEKAQMAIYERLRNKKAVSEKEYNIHLFSLESAGAKLASKEASCAIIANNIERSTVRAPIAGQILQVNITKGNNSSAYKLKPAMLMGQIDEFRVKAEINSVMANKIYPNMRAIAYLRDNSQLELPLDYLYLEPVVVPKRIINSDNELDNRVLKVVFKFSPGEMKIYPGQLLDIYLENK